MKQVSYDDKCWCICNFLSIFRCSFILVGKLKNTELQNTKDTETLRGELSQLTNLYYSKYKPSTQTLKKHRLLKKLKRNKYIAITHPDEGNGVVIKNRSDYVKVIYDIREDNSEIKKLRPNLIKTFCNCKKQLQRFIRTLRKTRRLW